MAKIKRIEKIKENKTMEEEIEREVRGHYTIFPLINRKKTAKK